MRTELTARLYPLGQLRIGPECQPAAPGAVGIPLTFATLEDGGFCPTRAIEIKSGVSLLFLIHLIHPSIFSNYLYL